MLVFIEQSSVQDFKNFQIVKAKTAVKGLAGNKGALLCRFEYVLHCGLLICYLLVWWIYCVCGVCRFVDCFFVFLGCLLGLCVCGLLGLQACGFDLVGLLGCAFAVCWVVVGYKVVFTMFLAIVLMRQ